MKRKYLSSQRKSTSKELNGFTQQTQDILEDFSIFFLLDLFFKNDRVCNETFFEDFKKQATL